LSFLIVRYPDFVRISIESKKIKKEVSKMNENFFVELETETETEFSDRFLEIIEKQFGFKLLKFDDGVARFFHNPRIRQDYCGYSPFMSTNPRTVYTTCSKVFRGAVRNGMLKLTD
jgi:hypothetical protein